MSKLSWVVQLSLSASVASVYRLQLQQEGRSGRILWWTGGGQFVGDIMEMISSDFDKD